MFVRVLIFPFLPCTHTHTHTQQIGDLEDKSLADAFSELAAKWKRSEAEYASRVSTMEEAEVREALGHRMRRVDEVRPAWLVNVPQEVLAHSWGVLWCVYAAPGGGRGHRDDTHGDGPHQASNRTPLQRPLPVICVIVCEHVWRFYRHHLESFPPWFFFARVRVLLRNRTPSVVACLRALPLSSHQRRTATAPTDWALAQVEGVVAMPHH